MDNFINIIEEDVFIFSDINALKQLFGDNTIDRPYYIIYCIEGTLEIEMNSKVYSLKPNNILLCTPFDKLINLVRSDECHRVQIVCLSERIMIENFNLHNDLWEKSFAVYENPLIEVSKKTLELYECYGKLIMMRSSLPERQYRKEVITTILSALIYEFFYEIHIHSKRKNPNEVRVRVFKQGDILFRRFITLLSKTSIKSRMVGWYANELCVTPKYLSTTCKNISGKTANGWINQYVVRDIEHLLKHSDKSIKEISEYMNFPNLSFFGKYVKAHLGCSPKEYRNRIKNR